MSSKKNLKIKKPSGKKKGVDHPLEEPKDDCLDRNEFAEKIFKIIEGTPSEIHLRVGINGDWGSGKTTILNFIKTFCKNKNYPIATFNPWHFKNEEEAWQGFAISIDAGLTEWKNEKWGTVKRKQFLKGISEKAKSVAKLCNSELGGLISQLVIDPLSGHLEQNKQSIQELLTSKLGNNRLYIFVDDLDRANPDILYNLLMFLNEVVDLNQCIFIIAYDSKIAATIIEQKTGVESGKEFLEKIINWDFDLPCPADYEWKALINSELKSLDKGIKKEVLESLFSNLPKNPRRLKHYLRYMSGLHKEFLSRFNDGELKWDTIYLGQLFKLEFPGEFNKIIRSEETLKEFYGSSIRDITRQEKGGDNNSEEVVRREIFLKPICQPIPDEKKERFVELYLKLRDLCSLIPEKETDKNLRVLDNPETLTWKEYYGQKELILSAPDDKKLDKLKKILCKGASEKEKSRSRDFLKMLAEDRYSNIGGVLDEHDQEVMKEKLLQDNHLINICELALDVPGLFSGDNPIFNESVFSSWKFCFRQTAHFDTGIYQNKSKNEKALFRKLGRQINTSQVSLFMRLLNGRLPMNTGSISEKGFAPIRKELIQILEPKLMDDIYSRFEKPNGVQELINPEYRPEQEFIFDKESLFHKDKNYGKLRDLTARAKDDVVIWENFLGLCRMHFIGAREPFGWVSQEKGEEILKIKKYRDLIWKAVVSRKMNRRSLGTLEEKRIIAEKYIGAGTFPTPQWWEIMLEE